MKYCTKCCQDKDVSEWSKNKNKRDGLSTWCKSCMADYRATNKDTLYEKRRQYYRNNPTRYKDKASRAWRDSLRDGKYGLIPGTISNMLEWQEYKCANKGCNAPIDWESSNVDHDHNCCAGSSSCGKCVRGLLCRSCNWALGHINDDTDKLSGLIEYLKVLRKSND